MAGYLPRSEGELYRARPGSNRSGAFPRSALLGPEKIIYETRPTFVAYQPLLFWTVVPIVAFFALVAAAGISTLGDSSGAIVTDAVLGLLVLLPILGLVARWRRAGYAVTDQRVVTRNGELFDSVPLVRVRAVRLGRKSSTLVFDLLPDPSDPPTGLLQKRPPTLEWKGVPGAPGVATFTNSAVRFFQVQQRQRQLRDTYVSASMEDRVVCEYCGALIPVANLSPDNPKCPRCAAPILVAPLGM